MGTILCQELEESQPEKAKDLLNSWLQAKKDSVPGGKIPEEKIPGEKKANSEERICHLCSRSAAQARLAKGSGHTVRIVVIVGGLEKRGTRTSVPEMFLVCRWSAWSQGVLTNMLNQICQLITGLAVPFYCVCVCSISKIWMHQRCSVMMYPCGDWLSSSPCPSARVVLGVVLRLSPFSGRKPRKSRNFARALQILQCSGRN